MLASKTSTKPSLVWQGLTKDGYTLLLTRVGVARITSNLKRTGLENLVQSNKNANLTDAIVRSVAQIVSNATRFKTQESSYLDRQIHVFTVQGKRRNFQILTQPINNKYAGIIFIRSQPRGIEQEWEQESESGQSEIEQTLQEGEYESRPNKAKKSQLKNSRKTRPQSQGDNVAFNINKGLLSNVLNQARQSKKPVARDANALLKEMDTNTWQILSSGHVGGLGGQGRAADPRPHITLQVGRTTYHLHYAFTKNQLVITDITR
ncbi:hypothetical protein [Nostoc sp. JL23]|uniref:hypothetical protein n=1 Tax=Nostoc sp. JL23 TaxID=2815394 RepID=UPI001D292F5F|nr:hypothetical protein [Nostoc sp. JL23]MBN3878092.1 hypothetical protein [Nostoc sp. JL23]